MSRNSISGFVFKKNMSIGEVDAESDIAFLEDCFVDNGDYEILATPENSHSIVVGRTGAGKSALIKQLERNENSSRNLHY